MRLACIAFLCALALAGCAEGGGDRAGSAGGRDESGRAVAGGLPSVEPADLAAHLSELDRIAARAGGERAAGGRGYAGSVRYVVARLRDLGWRVRLRRFRYRGYRERSLSVRPAGARALRPGREARSLGYSGEGRASGPLRDVGLGCGAIDFDRLEPGELALARSGGCPYGAKAGNAARASAGALLIAERRRGGVSSATLAPGVGIPAVLLSRSAAARLESGRRLSVRVGTLSRTATGASVIAETRAASRSVVMAGAHLDSVQAGPGMNDNGSGVAALLELAAALGPRPAGARIRLGFWGAEELGLWGSSRYVAGLSRAERGRIAAYLNFDMLGSPNGAASVYAASQSARRARPAARRIERLLRRLVGKRRAEAPTFGGSDHVAFARAGVPVGGLFTGAGERGRGGRPRDPCYHRPCDTARNVDVELLARMARAAEAALRELALQAK